MIEGVGSFVLDRESAVLTQPVLELLAAVWNGTTDAAGPTTLATEILPGNVFSALRFFGPFWPRWAKHESDLHAGVTTLGRGPTQRLARRVNLDSTSRVQESKARRLTQVSTSL